MCHSIIRSLTRVCLCASRRLHPARGLSKFQVDTFERRLQFAYRLMDLDGDGSLDKFELNAAMKAALDTDTSQYATGPAKPGGIKMPFRARPVPAGPPPRGITRPIHSLHSHARTHARTPRTANSRSPPTLPVSYLASSSLCVTQSVF